METWLINLDRSTARLAEFSRLNGHVPFQRFAAVDGQTISREALAAHRIIQPDAPYSDGAVGVALSHLSLWERAARNDQALTICEDDAILHPDFPQAARQLLDGLDRGFDFVMWGWNFDSVLLIDFMPGVSPALVHFDQEAMRAGTGRFRAASLSPQLFRLQRAFGICCYTVSPAGARKLIDACLPIRPMSVDVPGLPHPVPNYGIDVLMNAVYPGIDAYASFPPLAITPNDHAASTIQGTG